MRQRFIMSPDGRGHYFTYERLDEAAPRLAQLFHVAEHVGDAVLFDELHVGVDGDEHARAAGSVAARFRSRQSTTLSHVYCQ